MEFLDEEIARSGKVRQQLIELRRLYEKEEALPEAEAPMAVSTEDMIVRVVENAHLVLTKEEVKEGVRQDYGIVPGDFDEVLEKALQRATRIQMNGGGIGLVARSAAALKAMRKVLNLATGKDEMQTENNFSSRRRAHRRAGRTQTTPTPALPHSLT